MRRGMALGEALARCPDLALVPGRSGGGGGGLGVDAALAGSDRRGGRAGARPGLAYFETGPLRALHGTDAATIAAARGAGQGRGPSPGSGEPGRRGAPPGERRMRMGAGPTRFCALAAALAVRSRRPLVLEGSEACAGSPGRPIELLGFRAETEQLLEPLLRLGVRTLGELARLGRPALADRFGEAGVLAHRLACGEDTPLQPRRVEERLEETMSVGDASSGPALERVLGVLVDRLLARSERRGRTLRAVTLSARLLSGGGWRERVVFRQALGDRERISLALSLRLLLLPAPAATLGLAVERFGPPAGEQGALLDEGARGARMRACARRSPRCARWRGRTRRCGPSASIPTRACRSGGSCSRRCRADGHVATAHATRQLNLPRPARVRSGRGGRAAAGRRARDRAGARVLAGGGSLVDGAAAAPPLLGGGDHERAQPGRLPRPRRSRRRRARRRLVRPGA